jgi:phosphatidyl-myo-inositol dimannoside synthase
MARYYADLANAWGAGCTVMCGAWNGMPAAATGAATVISMPGIDARTAHRPVEVYRAAHQVRERIRSDSPSIVLAGNIRPYALPVRRIGRSTGLPWGFFLHGLDILRTERSWKRHPVKRFRWHRLMEASFIICNSRFTAGEAERAGLPSNRMLIVPPEVDTTRFRPPRNRDEVREARRRLGLPIDGLLTLFVGRLVERKGIRDLFAALRFIDDARLVVAGAGPVEPWQECAHAAGVADRVHFIGSPGDDDLPRLYRAADVFAAPSRHLSGSDEVEGFGIVFLEAQASGLPVIATRTGGIPEAVREGQTALLVEPGDIEALAASWRRLLTDDEFRSSLGRAGPTGPPAIHGPGSSAAFLAEGLRGAAAARAP